MKFEPSYFVATFGFYVVNGNPTFEVEEWRRQRFIVKQVVAKSSNVTFN